MYCTRIHILKYIYIYSIYTYIFRKKNLNIETDRIMQYTIYFDSKHFEMDLHLKFDMGPCGFPDPDLSPNQMPTTKNIQSS